MQMPDCKISSFDIVDTRVPGSVVLLYNTVQ
jgi:hypothetical protein